MTSVASANTANFYRLYVLRNIAIAWQIAVVTLAKGYVGLPLPLLPLGLIIACLALFNLGTRLALGRGYAPTSLGVFLQLLVDVLALTGLLYFSGGATNPFVLLFLLPLTIAVTALPGKYTWGLVGFTVACYSFLMWRFVPLPEAHSHDGGFGLHVFGMWLGFVLSAGLIGYFVVGMGTTLRRQEQALAEAREQALRDERLVALGTLAASTAHELGTPLGTMALLVEEIDEVLGDEAAQLRPQLDTLRTQIERCKGALSTLSASAGGVQLGGGGVMPIDHYLADVLTQWRRVRPAAAIETDWKGSRPVPQILADRTLTQAVTNILDNAADVSRQAIEWSASWDAHHVDMEIRDCGPGLTAEAEESVGKRPYTEKPEGLGLGLFLAHGIIERFGGRVTLANRSGGGVTIHIQLPLADLSSGGAS
jgi:two-component system sensor histidine kinase RegB